MRVFLQLTLASVILMGTGLYVGCANFPFRNRNNAEIGDAEKYITGATQWSENFDLVLAEARDSNRLVLLNATGSDWCTCAIV